ncbi:hypothetical protein DsansV1_C08g0085541 [Dioscorea sansibarensis]
MESHQETYLTVLRVDLGVFVPLFLTKNREAHQVIREKVEHVDGLVMKMELNNALSIS